MIVDELKVWSAWLERAFRFHFNLPVEDLNQTWYAKLRSETTRWSLSKTFQKAFNTEINKSSGGAVIASLTYKEGRVNLHLKPDTQLERTSKSPMKSRGP